MQTVTGIDLKTKTLLSAGALAGPLYLGAAILHGLFQEGFDFARHSVSLLSLGDLGWIQIANFLVSGLLVIAGATGLRRTFPPGRGSFWGPALIAVYGLGLIASGVFLADPADGFPPGTPPGTAAFSLSGLLHFISGGIGFLALILACFVFAARFAAQGQRGWAAYSAATGLIFLLAFAGIASGPPQPWRIAGFWIGLLLAWAWISTLAVRTMGGLSRVGGYETI